MISTSGSSSGSRENNAASLPEFVRSFSTINHITDQLKYIAGLKSARLTCAKKKLNRLLSRHKKNYAWIRDGKNIITSKSCIKYLGMIIEWALKDSTRRQSIHSEYDPGKGSMVCLEATYEVEVKSFQPDLE